MRPWIVFALLVGACAASRPRVDSTGGVPPHRPASLVERADQLPAHRYPISGDVGRLVVDADAFAALARPLRADVERDLASFDIREATSLKDRLFILALLDALDARWPDALRRIDQIAAVEVDPASKAMTGLTLRVWADAIAHGGGADAFRAALVRRLDALPLEQVRAQLSMLRAMGQVFTPETCRQLVDAEVGPRVEHGTISLAQAQTIAFQRYAAVHLAPVGAVIDQVLGARGIEAPHE